MLITNNNIELRNLQEQVLKNKEDIAHHYEIDRTLSNFGIKIVGTVATVNDLPDPTLYEGEYGDGYAVGQPGSYTYYLFTRPDPNAGIYENHWLDVGQLAIQGPEGPVGPQGPQGETGQSTKWYTNQLAADENAKPGDLLLERNGDVFQYNGELSQWVLITNIKGAQGVQGPRGIQGEIGPQGIQGEKGDTGEAGRFVTIAGILTSNTQLPLPSTLRNLTIAYLIGTSEPYKLWIQVGDDVETAIWEDMGPFNVATAITVGGQFRSTWNADTKLDKNTSVTQYNQLYTKAADGGEEYINVTKLKIGDAVVQRKSDGNISLPYIPSVPDDATSKIYVDDKLGYKLDLIEPAARETDFVTIVKDYDGYHQENLLATYTPRASYQSFVGVLRGTKGDLRGMVPENPHTYTLVNIEYLRAHAPVIHSLEIDNYGNKTYLKLINNSTTAISTFTQLSQNIETGGVNIISPVVLNSVDEGKIYTINAITSTVNQPGNGLITLVGISTDNTQETIDFGVGITISDNILSVLSY
jgi:hypothetical protein